MSRNSTGAGAPDLADHARHRRLVVPMRARDHGGVVGVDAFERGRKAVGIAFAADFAVGDDIDAGALHVADRDDRWRRPAPPPDARSAAATSRACGCAARISTAWRDRPASPAADSFRPPSSATDVWAGSRELSLLFFVVRSRAAATPAAMSSAALWPPRVPVCQIAALRSIQRIAALKAIAIASTSSTPAKTCGLSRMVR